MFQSDIDEYFEGSDDELHNAEAVENGVYQKNAESVGVNKDQESNIATYSKIAGKNINSKFMNNHTPNSDI